MMRGGLQPHRSHFPMLQAMTESVCQDKAVQVVNTESVFFWGVHLIGRTNPPKGYAVPLRVQSGI